MLYFYFVDPSTPILSTTFAPSQQMSWLIPDIMDVGKGGRLGVLPELVKDSIIRYLSGGPMTV